MKGEKNGVDNLNCKFCPPRSELWTAFELNNNLTLDDKDDGKSEKNIIVLQLLPKLLFSRKTCPAVQQLG